MKKLLPDMEAGIRQASPPVRKVFGRGERMPHQYEHAEGNGLATLAAVASGDKFLSGDRCLEIYRLMVRSRIMEERMIKMSKSGEGYFWIGGPGEEAFNVALGLQIKKGEGPDFDYLHLHYRNSATLVAMGMPLIDGIRQMAMTFTDPHSRGRNFVGHFALPKWNVLPVSSVIGVGWVKAPGTAHVQKRHGGDSITIVTGGDAGTAEGDFNSCMIWSTRPGNELPLLMIVMNNGFGISTPASTQHSESRIIDRGKPFGIPGEVVDGNDPIASWYAIERAMELVRTKRRPYMIEALVSRLYGHSSSSGALRVKGEPDCIPHFEHKLREAGIVDEVMITQIHDEAVAECEAALEQTLTEPKPTAEDVRKFTYASSDVDAVYPDDYTGLPNGD
jgi:2-oxoisovalerate dehydrogenase E1 component alpha subunit